MKTLPLNWKYYTLVFCFSIVAFCACTKLKKSKEFDLEYISEVFLPSSIKLNIPFNASTPDIRTQSETYFEINDTRKDHIQEIKTKSIVLNITSPSAGNFNFLKSIEVFIVADGLQEVKVASKYEIPDNDQRTLELEVADKDIKEYIKADKFKLTVSTVTDQLMTTDYRIESRAMFHIKASLFKQ